MKKPIDLSQFTGSERKYQIHPRFYLTEGAHFLAETGCYWLMDIIWSYHHQLSSETFQLWEIVNDEDQAVVTCRSDSDEEPLVIQSLEYSAFEHDTGLKSLKLFACIDGDGVTVMIPSEY